MARLGLLAALLGMSTSACQGGGAAAESSPKELFERVRGETIRREVEPATNPDFIPVGKPRERVRIWYLLRGPEQQLASKGTSATPLLLAAARDRAEPAAWRERCLRILSQMRDPAAAPAVLAILKDEPGTALRVEGLRVLALTRDAALQERVRDLPGAADLPRKRVLWTLAMLGDRGAEGEFLRRAGESLQELAHDPATAEPDPLPEVPSAKRPAPVLQPPGPVGDVPEDLADLSLLETPAAVGMLIEALGSRETLILDTAEQLLRRVMDGDLGALTGVPWGDPVNLYSHRTYRELTRWWQREQARVRWDAGKRKFAVDPRR